MSSTKPLRFARSALNRLSTGIGVAASAATGALATKIAAGFDTDGTTPIAAKLVGGARFVESASLFTSSARVASFGDSRAYADNAGAPQSLTANLRWQWITALTGGRVVCPPELRFGHGGYSTVLLSADPLLGDAVSRAVVGGARFVEILCSTNDRNSDVLSYANTVTNLTKIEAAFLAAGIVVVWIAELPRGDAGLWTGADNPPSQPALGFTRLQRHLAVRRWLLSRRRENVYVLDLFSVIADRTVYANSNAGYARVGLLGDGLHPGTNGCYQLGKFAAAFWNSLVPSFATPYLPANAADNYDATSGTGSIVANAAMNGTGGSVTAGTTGVAATSWVTGSSLPAGLTATYSKPIVDGREWQQVVYSGTAPTGTPVHNAIQRDTTFGTNAVAVGKKYVLACEYEIDAGCTGIYKINPFMNDGTGGVTWSAMDSSSSFAYGEYPSEAYRGVFFTDTFTVAGTGPSLRAGVAIGFTASAAISLTLRIGNLAVIPL